jgi:hypothetical protein
VFAGVPRESMESLESRQDSSGIQSHHPLHLRSAVTYGRSVPMTCINTGGRGRYRTADRWCVKPELYH